MRVRPGLIFEKACADCDWLRAFCVQPQRLQASWKEARHPQGHVIETWHYQVGHLVTPLSMIGLVQGVEADPEVPQVCQL